MLKLRDVPALADLHARLPKIIHERYRKCANQRAYRARLKAREVADVYQNAVPTTRTQDAPQAHA